MNFLTNVNFIMNMRIHYKNMQKEQEVLIVTAEWALLLAFKLNSKG